MENFKVTVNDEEYEIGQHEELKGLFFVYHESGLHKLAKNHKTGEWKFYEHRAGTQPIDLETFSRIIEERL